MLLRTKIAILTIVSLVLSSSHILAQQDPAPIHRFALFVNGFSPDSFPVSPIDPEQEPAAAHVGFLSSYSVVNSGDEATEVRFRFVGEDGSEIDIPLLKVRRLVLSVETPGTWTFQSRRTQRPLFGWPSLPETIIPGPLPDPEPVTNPFTLAPGGAIVVHTRLPDAAGFSTGHVLVESTAPIGVEQALQNAIVLFQGDNRSDLPNSGVPVRAADPVRAFRVLAIQDFFISTGIALRSADPGSGEEVSGRLRLVESDGREISALDLTLGQEGAVVTLTELFPDAPGFSEGTIVGDFESDLLVVSFAFLRGFGQLLQSNPIVRVESAP